MSKQTEALKLALEALKKTQDEGYNLPGTAIREAITAIREALAHALTEREQPEQHTEPCGWRMKHNGEWVYSFTKDSWDFIYAVSPAARKAARDNAPASKPWVGLTDEEKSLFSSWLDLKTDAEVFSAIEAKLREKNNG